jgi:transposase
VGISAADCLLARVHDIEIRGSRVKQDGQAVSRARRVDFERQFGGAATNDSSKLRQGGNRASLQVYDTNAPRHLIAEAGAEAVIPSRARCKISIPHNALAYRLRNRIERFFNKLKHFRDIATRYDRRAVYFLACLHLASAMIWMR